MNSNLYVYDDKTLKYLKDKLKDYNFFSIAYLFHKCDKFPELYEMDMSIFEKSVVDITNLIKDGNYYKIFTERYLYTLSENISEICFCINSNMFEIFIQQFPYVFEETSIQFDFYNSLKESEKRDAGIDEFSPSDVLIFYTYKELSVVKERYKEGKIISLSDLVDEWDGIYFRYNVERVSRKLESYEVEYIDISSIIKMLKIRQDLIFQFEVFMHQIMLHRKIKFCIEYNLISDINTLFPFWITEEMATKKNDFLFEKANEESKHIDVNRITELVAEINGKLRGHDDFKIDFRHNILKFTFLNKMGERKILSIILCGDSGIGKTEFAKIVSQVMFPDDSLIKINFGNYSTEGVLNSLIGSPLGYQGSEEGGELINKISTSKSKVILIDEFEKATPSVHNFFYELLEDGMFTDRHGVIHNLNGYIIVFTSNMTQTEYHKCIPDSLKSRFDMVYYFVELSKEEKLQFIYTEATDLIGSLEEQFKIKVVIQNIQTDLDKLTEYNNLRDIKRKVEDIVFNEFIRYYEKSD